VFQLDAGADAGSFICVEQGSSNVRFGSDLGQIVEFDLRDGAKPATVVQRADQARITSLFGKGRYSTSIGTVVHGDEEKQVAEVGQSIVRAGKLQERLWAITSSGVIFF
jgi:ABC-type phosphate transport system auxiliary subunit